jgi:hypothetical protein
MRCQPFSLARITDVPEPLAGLRGRVVKLRQPFESKGQDAWLVAGPLHFLVTEDCRLNGKVFMRGDDAELGAVFDAWLTPVAVCGRVAA